MLSNVTIQPETLRTVLNVAYGVGMENVSRKINKIRTSNPPYPAREAALLLAAFQGNAFFGTLGFSVPQNLICQKQSIQFQLLTPKVLSQKLRGLSISVDPETLQMDQDVRILNKQHGCPLAALDQVVRENFDHVTRVVDVMLAAGAETIRLATPEWSHPDNIYDEVHSGSGASFWVGIFSRQREDLVAQAAYEFFINKRL